MGCFNNKQPVQLDTDAWQSGFAAILTQIQAKHKHKRCREQLFQREAGMWLCHLGSKNGGRATSTQHQTHKIVTDCLQYQQHKGNDSSLVQRFIVCFHNGKESIVDFLSCQNDRQKHTAATVTTTSVTLRQKQPDNRALNGDRSKRVTKPQKEKEKECRRNVKSPQQEQPCAQTQKHQVQKQPLDDETPIKAQLDDSNIQRM